MSELNRPLEEALAAGRRGEISLQETVQELMASEVLVPADRPEPPTDHAQVRLPTYEVRGLPVIPVFSSEDRMGPASGLPRLRSPMHELLSAIPPEVGIVVNPGSEIELVIPADDVEYLTGREAPIETVKVPPGTRVFVGEPAAEPVAFLSLLRRVLTGMPSVQAAYRAQVLIPAQSQQPRLVIGLLANDRLPPTALDQIARLGSTPGQEFELLVLEGSSDADPVARYMLDHTDPFFLSAQSARS